MEINEIFELQKTCIEPGEMLILSSEKELSEKTISRLHDLLKLRFPNNEILVLGGGLKLEKINKVDLARLME